MSIEARQQGITHNGTGIYAVPDAETLKFSINLNRVLRIYLVSKR